MNKHNTFLYAASSFAVIFISITGPPGLFTWLICKNMFLHIEDVAEYIKAMAAIAGMYWLFLCMWCFIINILIGNKEQ